MFGYEYAFASASYIIQLFKGKSINDTLKIKNTNIILALQLSPIKNYCLILNEEALKIAIQDLKSKKRKLY